MRAERCYTWHWATHCGICRMSFFVVFRQGGSRASAALAIAAFMSVAFMSANWIGRANATEDWTTYQNKRYGYSLSYPSRVFTPQRTFEDAGGQVFVNANGSAKLVAYGALNDKKYTPAEYRKVILGEFQGYDQMDYSPQGKTWFVLSGYRGDTIYYQKVMFSCENRLINAFSITFLRAEKKFYEGLVEVMEDHFRTAGGATCPTDLR